MVQTRGISQLVADLHRRELFVASSVPAFYTAAAHNVLVITGGLVWIHMLLEYQDVTVTNATTTIVAINGLNQSTAAVDIADGALFIRVIPFDAAVVQIASALVSTAPSLTGHATNRGVVSGPGNIQVTFATVMAAAGRYSLHALYEKIHENALIV